MKTSKQGMLDILSHEAIVQTRYKDDVGVWTIAAGHTKAAGGINPAIFLDKLSIEECISIFKEDLIQYEDEVNKAFTVELTQEQFDAAVSFNYNTGAILRAGWVKHVNAGRLSNAEYNKKSGIMAWRKPKSVISRRKLESRLFFQGQYNNQDGYVVVYKTNKYGNIKWSSAEKIKVELDKPDNVSHWELNQIKEPKVILETFEESGKITQEMWDSVQINPHMRREDNIWNSAIDAVVQIFLSENIFLSTDTLVNRILKLKKVK